MLNIFLLLTMNSQTMYHSWLSTAEKGQYDFNHLDSSILAGKQIKCQIDIQITNDMSE